MNVIAYTQLHRTAIRGTGISRHANNMIRGLAANPDMSVRVAASRQDLVGGTHIGAESGLCGMPVIPLPFAYHTLERLWWLTGVPPIETWTGPTDWVYCPADAYVPTKRARLAITIHDVAWLEPDLPWSDTFEHRRFQRRVRAKMGPILRHASLVLVASEFTRRRLIDLTKVDPQRVVYVGNGVEDVFFLSGAAAIPVTCIAPRQPYVVILGGLTERKGAEQILRTAAIVQHESPDVVFAVAGRSEPQWQEKARAFPNIIHLGYVSPEDLPSLLHHSVALYFPSRYEGFGIPVVEAMAAGTPAIISPHASLPEVAGDAGLIVPDDAPEQAAMILKTFARDRDARRAIVRRGRARAESYRWEACVTRLTHALSAG